MPHLKIQLACKDVCNDCYVYKNKFKYKSSRDDNSLGVEWWEKWASEGDMCFEGDEEMNKFLTVDEDVEEREMLVEAAVIHVRQAKVQRDMVNMVSLECFFNLSKLTRYLDYKRMLKAQRGR